MKEKKKSSVLLSSQPTNQYMWETLQWIGYDAIFLETASFQAHTPPLSCKTLRKLSFTSPST